MKAVRKRNLPLAKLLIERKANVNYMERQSEIRWYVLDISHIDLFENFI